MRRRLPIGAEPVDGGVHFRVWAPRRERVAIVLGDGAHALEPEPGGYFSGWVAEARAGDRYRIRLDDAGDFPDPASRCQPEGPHGASEVIAPEFDWSDGGFPGPDPTRQVLYELHVGCFTPDGTFSALQRELDRLVDLGVTCLELMPLAEFPGRFGWGYDGVNLFAPSHLYGRPDELRALVNAAHTRGLSVILDVVYNHLGPDGNHLAQFGPYVSARHRSEWGDTFDFAVAGVRELFVANARMWVDEYHFDGLRLDATQSMHDASPRHVLAEIAAAVRAAGGTRRTLLVAENEPQQAELVRPPEAGGLGLDLVWNDDFHHAALVAATGRREAYFMDYTGSAQELVSAALRGFLFQGQRYFWQNRPRGTPARDVPAWRFVSYLQNHDQVANSATGARLAALTSPAELRALTAFWLLSPETPMVFMGQEAGLPSPFLYFADHHEALARAVRDGRRAFLEQFPSIATREGVLDDPSDARTFVRSKLSWERASAEVLALHRDLLAMRRDDPVFSDRAADVAGAVLDARAFVLRYTSDRGDRLVLVNLGAQHTLRARAEPLLAPPAHAAWTVAFSSAAVRYGGPGAPALERPDGAWELPARATLVLREAGT